MSAFRSRAKILSQIPCNDIHGSRPISVQHENLQARFNHSIAELKCLTKTAETQEHEQRSPQITISRSLFSLFRKNAPTKEGNKSNINSSQKAGKEEKGESWLARILPKQPRKLNSQERCIRGPQEKQEIKINKIPNPEWKPSVVIVTTNNCVPKQQLPTAAAAPAPPPSLHPVPPPSVETRLIELQEKHNTSTPDTKIEVDMNRYVPKLPYTEFKPKEIDVPEKFSIENFEESNVSRKDTPDNSVRKRSTSANGPTIIDRKFSWYTQQSVERTKHPFPTSRSNKALMYTGRRNLQYFTHRNCMDHEKHGKMRGHSLQMQVNKRKSVQAQIQNKEPVHILPMIKSEGTVHVRSNSNVNECKNVYTATVPKLNMIEKSPIKVAKVPIPSNKDYGVTPLNTLIGNISEVPLTPGQNKKNKIISGIGASVQLIKKHNFQTQQQGNSTLKLDLTENKKIYNFQQPAIQHKDLKYTKRSSSEIKREPIGESQSNLGNFPRHASNINSKMSSNKLEKREIIQKFDQRLTRKEIFPKENEIDVDEIKTLTPKEKMRNWIKRIEEKEKGLGNQQITGHTSLKRTTCVEANKQFTSHNKIKHVQTHYTTNDMKSKIIKSLAQEKLKKKNKARVSKFENNNSAYSAQLHTENNTSQQSNKSYEFPHSVPQTQLTVQESLTKYLSERLKSQTSTYSSTTNQKDILWKDIVGYKNANTERPTSQKKLVQYAECETRTVPKTQLHSSYRPCSEINNLPQKFDNLSNNLVRGHTLSSAKEQNMGKIVNSLLEKGGVQLNSVTTETEKVKKLPHMTFVNTMYNSSGAYAQENSQSKNENQRDPCKQGFENFRNIHSLKHVRNEQLPAYAKDCPYGPKEKHKLPEKTFQSLTPDEHFDQKNKILEEKPYPTDSLLLKDYPEIHHNMTEKVIDSAKPNINKDSTATENVASPIVEGEEEIKSLTIKPNEKDEQQISNYKENENLSGEIKACASDENSAPRVLPHATNSLTVRDSQMEWLTHNTYDQKCLPQTYLSPALIYETIQSKPFNYTIPVGPNHSSLNKTWSFSDFAAYFNGTMFSKPDMLNMYLDKAMGNTKESANILIDNILTSTSTAETKNNKVDQNVIDAKSESPNEINHTKENLVENEIKSKELSISEEEGIENDESFNAISGKAVSTGFRYHAENEQMNKNREDNYQHMSQKNKSNTVSTRSSTSSLHAEVQCSTKRNYSQWSVREPYNPRNSIYECKKHKECKSRKIPEKKKPESKDSVKQLDCPDKLKLKSDCKKIHLPGCRNPTLRCSDEPVEQLPCVKREAPAPSFSECLRYPFGKRKLTECDCHKPKHATTHHCPPNIHTRKSYDACKKLEKKEKKKKDVCDKDSDEDDDECPC